MAVLIDGKAISSEIKEELKQEVAELKAQGITPCLAVILVGDDSASAIYVRNKKRACEYIGIESRSYELPKETTEQELEKLVRELNEDETVDGILVQLPLPEQIDEERITGMISPKKDVDGFLPESIGALCIGSEGFRSCTPAGVLELIKRSGYTIEGKECVVVGRSNHVGKPMALLLLEQNGTVTIAHSRTKNLSEITRRADILVVAVGNPKLIQADDVKEGAVVIDVGMNRDENGKLCGDVDFEHVKEKAEAITPVPGGVGPMTIAMLMNNCVEAARKKRRE
ncbi:bifunctional methylenetetrahydrofolate dehydrogenase/methenyltetrahydrofolate cyclohydrolase FolD [Ruminococcus sp. OM05-10BH]|nr:bifunctional methylenetetrahydrofolate dehydrogenase/methenyltetrahydrofolate cyclohydrolase FolD [Ruminococcus sp. OM05-10BH]